ncbi:pyruvate formate-lyase-activating protein [Clostridium sp.]|uniref:pyruvate formate-lyase-activating protein n=1 Tax=Clostridium sp. TaxID=1506 RepID=UPI002FCB048E
MITGRVHSIETMGLVDGPGIRVVIFMQGCKLRCIYCHNPDTWSINSGDEITPKELLKKVIRYKIYFRNSGGGVTLSGGDPLLQTEFSTEFFRLCKEQNIHTCLDTSGYGEGDYEELLKYTDLVLLDVKHIDDKIHKFITGRNRDEFIKFVNILNSSGTKVWIRHVMLEGYTDDEEYLKSFAEYVDSVNNVEKIELLAYHTHGVSKYEELGIKYRIKEMEPFSKESLIKAKDTVHKYLKNKSIKMH